MGQLTVRCFGGFDVRIGDSTITDFESLKVKALFAYLVVQRERSFSRPVLAELLWPNRPEEAARRNLRQAAYNLRSVLASHGVGPSPVETRGHELRFNPELDCWLDIDEFLAARRRGISRAAIVHHDLAAAVALYRGDFLSGFAVKASPDFELWQLTEQQRLRDQAVDSLCVLIESYLSRGELRLGLQYSRRLLAIDPLSERAHRYLMQLYALSGRRRQALAKYEHLKEALKHELGVEPMAETRQLYELVLKDQATPQEKEHEEEQEKNLGIGPLIPLVGRHEPYRQLHEHWREVQEGRCRLTIVEGEAGIGKTRLVRSFLDAAGSQRPTMIIKGRCSESVPAAYQPFDQLLRNAVAEDLYRARRVLESSSSELLADLGLLIPGWHALLPDLESPAEPARQTDRIRLFESVGRFLERLCEATGDDANREPLVLMLGDLQWARQETVALIEHLLERLATSPMWILGTCRPEGLGGSLPLVRRLISEIPGARGSRILLERLEPEAVEQLASALVGADQAAELAGLLIRCAEGLPLAIAEWINFLWDEHILIYDAGRWRLGGSLEAATGDLETLVRRRLHRLPASTRRLASQAAVIGQQFDARLLTAAADEHPRVVDVGLELMLERWMVRQHSDHWTSGRRERDMVLWAHGARLGSFEFSHRIIGEAMLEDIHPRRRRILHQAIARALEKHLGDDVESFSEILGFHHTQAGNWDRAIVHLRRAARRARTILATDTALYYARQAVEVLDRLRAAARQPDKTELWDRERAQAVAVLEEIESLGI